MYFCMSRALEYFLVMMSTDAYITISMYAMILCGLLPSTAPVAWVCPSWRASPWVTYMPAWWIHVCVCRLRVEKYYTLNFCPNWKIEFMYFCMLRALEYFLLMMSIDAYITISMYAMILCGLLPSTAPVAWVCPSWRASPWVTYIPAWCIHVCVCRLCAEKYYTSNFCPNWKIEFKAMKCFYENIGPTTFTCICIFSPQ